MSWNSISVDWICRSISRNSKESETNNTAIRIKVRSHAIIFHSTRSSVWSRVTTLCVVSQTVSMTTDKQWMGRVVGGSVKLNLINQNQNEISLSALHLMHSLICRHSCRAKETRSDRSGPDLLHKDATEQIGEMQCWCFFFVWVEFYSRLYKVVVDRLSSV